MICSLKSISIMGLSNKYREKIFSRHRDLNYLSEIACQAIHQLRTSHLYVYMYIYTHIHSYKTLEFARSTMDSCAMEVTIFQTHFVSVCVCVCVCVCVIHDMGTRGNCVSRVTFLESEIYARCQEIKLVDSEHLLKVFLLQPLFPV